MSVVYGRGEQDRKLDTSKAGSWSQPAGKMRQQSPTRGEGRLHPVIGELTSSWLIGYWGKQGRSKSLKASWGRYFPAGWSHSGLRIKTITSWGWGRGRVGGSQVLRQFHLGSVIKRQRQSRIQTRQGLEAEGVRKATQLQSCMD